MEIRAVTYKSGSKLLYLIKLYSLNGKTIIGVFEMFLTLLKCHVNSKSFIWTNFFFFFYLVKYLRFQWNLKNLFNKFYQSIEVGNFINVQLSVLPILIEFEIKLDYAD